MLNSDSILVRHGFLEEGIIIIIIVVVVIITIIIIITMIATLWQQDINNKNGINILEASAKSLTLREATSLSMKSTREVRYQRTLETRKPRKELSAHV